MNYSHDKWPSADIGGGFSSPESEKKSKYRTVLPIDLLSLETSPLLDISTRRPTEEGKGTIKVFFVDEEGVPVSKTTAKRIKKSYLPESTRLPTGDIGHSVLYGAGCALLVLSVNTREPLETFDVCALGGRVVRALEKYPFAHVTVNWDKELLAEKPGSDAVSSARALKEFVHGMQTATYRYVDLKAKLPDPRKLQSATVLGFCGKDLTAGEANEIIGYVSDVATAEHLSRRWIDTPAGNGAETEDMVELASRIFLEHESSGTMSFKVFSGAKLKAMGLDALYGVGKGSVHPPALAILRYQGGKETDPTIAFVGKTLVHDTGGEDTKPAGEHANMKGDMGGGAMVLAAFDLIVRRKRTVNLVVALAIADNCVSGDSRHPGTVLHMYRGKAVEDEHTDAEGRLAVGDACRYVEEHYHPCYLVTVATLTGAAVVALGTGIAALFGKTPLMVDVLKAAAEQTGSPVWHMPLKEARHAKLNKGKAGKPGDTTQLGPRAGGAITAAKFILDECCFLTKNAAHLDVAPVAMEAPDRTGKKADFATGYGPELLFVAAHMLRHGPSSLPRVGRRMMRSMTQR